MFKNTNISKSKFKLGTYLSSNVEIAGDFLKHLLCVPAYSQAGPTVLILPHYLATLWKSCKDSQQLTAAGTGFITVKIPRCHLHDSNLH